MSIEHQRGLLDTNIMILRRWIDPENLATEVVISSITLAELSAGPHQVGTAARTGYDMHAERARRLDVLQRAENEFDPPSRSTPTPLDLRATPHALLWRAP